MSNKKKGGARLDRSKPPKPLIQSTASAETSAEGGSSVPKKRLGKGARIAIIVAAVLLALLLLALILYKLWAKLPDVPPAPTPILPVESATPDPVTGETPTPVPTPEPTVSNRKKDFYTFLILGRDTTSGSPDTIMLGAYDVHSQKISVMSIPRDTMVDARHPGSNRKINAVWNLGPYYADKGDDRERVEYVREALGDMLGFTPDFHVIVNWKAFGRLVDAVGGVYFNVPFDMEYKDPDQDLVIDQPAGYRHLTGDDAMEIVRWRHNNSYSVQYVDGDLGRIRTQQALLKEIVKQCLRITNLTNIGEYAEIFSEEVETDLTLGNIVAFGERAILGGLSSDNVTFLTVPVSGVYVGKSSYVQAKPEELLEMLNKYFNPFLEDLSLEDLHILQYSSDTGYYAHDGDPLIRSIAVSN